jgi:hypothetical protein
MHLNNFKKLFEISNTSNIVDAEYNFIFNFFKIQIIIPVNTSNSNGMISTKTQNKFAFQSLN